MKIIGGHRTVCSVCQRHVGAVLNWEKRQAGRLAGEYRVARHAAEARPTSHQYGRRPICPGSGILIGAEHVTVADGGTLPAQSPGQSHGG